MVILLVGMSGSKQRGTGEHWRGKRKMIVTHAQNQQTQHIQRYLPIGDTIETQLAVLYREVSLIQRLICPHTHCHIWVCAHPQNTPTHTYLF